MAQNQKSVAGPIKMDSRKFLGALNQSAQAKVALYESIITRLGRESSKQWRLAALHTDTLFIEDVNTNTFLMADHKKVKGGRINISNLRPVEIYERSKKSLFEQSCRQLIECIESNDRKGMRTAFNKMSAQRFSSSIIPESGYVRARDGIARKIKVADATVGEDIKPRLIAAIVESMSDRVVLENGSVVGAEFGTDDQKFKLPITEWTCRKVVGRYMRTVAENAFQSKGFQDRVYRLAKMIDDDKIDEAIKDVAAFLQEQQEFCLLDRGQAQTLIENTLATRAVFNQPLCNDVATLFHRTNLKINRRSIIDEWRKTAQKAGQETLLENVQILEESKNFEAAYNKFLKMVFIEAVSPREVTVDAYKTALTVLKTTPKIQETPDLAGKIQALVDRLSESEVDHAVIAEVEDILAGAKTEMDAGQGLDDFDAMPGSEEMPEETGEEIGDLVAGGEEEIGGDAKGVTITINSPLIHVGDGSDAGGEEDLGGLEDSMDMGGEDMGGEEDLDMGDEEDDLDMGDEEDELGMGDEEEEEEFSFESKRKGKAIKESGKPWEKDGDDDCDDDDCDECDDCHSAPCCCESVESDPYALGEDIDTISGLGSSYGQAAVAPQDVKAVVESMITLAGAIAEDIDSLDETAIDDKIRSLAVQAIEESGLHVTSRRMNDTVDRIIEAFLNELGHRMSLDEDQYSWGTLMRRRGFRKSNYARDEHEKGADVGSGKKKGGGGKTETKTEGKHRESSLVESIQWVEHDEAAQGWKGVFMGTPIVYDYAEPPVLLSEDGSVEVPIPEEYHNSANAAITRAGTKREKRDLAEAAQPFLRWLSGGIEQFRSATAEEDAELNEAVARINTDASGNISIEVDSDDPVEVIDRGAPEDGMGGPEDGLEGGEDMLGGIGGEEALGGPEDGVEGGMEPVDTVPDEFGAEEGGEEMAAEPNFEVDDGEEEELGEDAFGDEEEELEEGTFGSDENHAPQQFVGASRGDSDDDVALGDDDSDPRFKHPGTPQPNSGRRASADGRGRANKLKRDKSGKPSVEDRDVTDPKKAKYNTAKDDKRKEAKSTFPKAGGKDLDGFNEKQDTGGQPTDMKKVKPGKNRPK